MPDARYALVVFDWDGTLIDSAGTIVTCIQEASRAMGLPVPEADRARHVIGLGLHDSLRMAVPELRRNDYAEFVAHYRDNFLAREDEMRLFPGVNDLLATLKARGHRLAVATGKSRRGLDRALVSTGLGEFFSASRCADETTPKPHPAMLLELLEELRCAAGDALMIGDTTHDLEMARGASVDALAVTYGAHREEQLLQSPARARVSSVAELRAWLDRHG